MDPIDDWIRTTFGRQPGRTVLRASDAEREEVADVLRKAHQEGRLDTAELEERLSRCYGAKTLSQLDELVVDLPRPPEPVQARRRGGWFPFPLAPIVALVAFAAIVTHGHLVWIVWPLAFLAFFRFARRRRRYWL